jgi:hypothetical protein
MPVTGSRLTMRKPDRALHEIAHRVLTAQSAAAPATTAAAADALQSSCGALYGILETSMGAAGLHALLERSIQITSREYPWLAAVKPGTASECALLGLAEAAGERNVAEVTEAYTALLASIIWLLITLIGDDLTLRFVRHAWPKASFSKLSEGSK